MVYIVYNSCYCFTLTVSLIMCAMPMHLMHGIPVRGVQCDRCELEIIVDCNKIRKIPYTLLI